ncbi:MAG: dehH, partial [Modestobacter sp.]|nr:dehH [Modestobacter sp.]
PLLLLHGYPETHLMWGAVAGELAEQFTVVAPDLRGYGESSAPAPTTDHANYGKRAMAADGVALMRELGFDRLDVAGHDRGGRVAYRMALDTPDDVTGQALDCGHFIVEERPAETLAALRSSTARSMRSARAGPPRRRPRLPDGVDAAGACRGCRRRRAPDVLAAPAQPGHAGRAGGRAGLPPSGHRAVSASRRAARAVTPSLGKTRYRCAPTVRGER